MAAPKAAALPLGYTPVNKFLLEYEEVYVGDDGVLSKIVNRRCIDGDV